MSLLGFVFAIIAGLAGGLAEGEEGFLLGLVVGYCFGAVIQLSKKVRVLEQRVREMSLTRVSSSTSTQETPAQPVTETDTERPVVEPAMYQPVSETPSSVEPLTQPASFTRKAKDQDVSAWQQQNTLFDKLFSHIKTFFTDGNVVLKVGLIVLFFGVGFLLKYAYEHSMLPVELRMAGAGLLGLALLIVGWRVRERKQVYALLLQGGGVGILYLTVFAAAKLYAMIPVGMAFVIMVALVVLSAILAILQDAKYLAIYGAAGGFLAPVLASTGSGNHVMLFSYYALLNAGIVGIAWYRAWRVLNLIGFGFTFVIGSLWGAKYYRPEFFVSVEPFLILFFVFFVMIAVLFAFRQPPKLKGYVDSTLVFGVPIIAFALQSALVHDMEYGMAFSALGMSALYIVLASVLLKRAPENMRLFTEALLALGVVFGSLAIPLALDGRWTAAAWALEGSAIVWVGVRQKRMLARAFGVLLQFGAGYFFLADTTYPHDVMPVLNGLYLGGLTVSLAGLFSSYYLYNNRSFIRDWEQGLHVPLLVWGLLWWSGAGLYEITQHANTDQQVLLWLLAFSTGSFLLAHFVEQKLQWLPMRLLMFAVLPVMYILLALSRLLGFDHPFDHHAWQVWPLSIAGFYFLLYRYQHSVRADILKWQHAVGFWFVMLFISWEAAWLVDEQIKGAHAWRDVMYALTPAITMFLLLTIGKRLSWPVAKNYEWYTGLAALPVMLVLALVAVAFGVLHEGNPWPLVYVPVFNPVDLVVAFLLYLIMIWWLLLQKQQQDIIAGFRAEYFSYAIAGMAFMWLNGMIARTIHHWFAVPYDLLRLMHAVEFKATISVIWTMVALSAMLYASRRYKRRLWFVGLGLFAVVVAKLFMFDISRHNTLAIIVSLLVVGGLTVVFGYYLSPLPPRTDDTEKQT